MPNGNSYRLTTLRRRGREEINHGTYVHQNTSKDAFGKIKTDDKPPCFKEDMHLGVMGRRSRSLPHQWREPGWSHLFLASTKQRDLAGAVGIMIATVLMYSQCLEGLERPPPLVRTVLAEIRRGKEKVRACRTKCAVIEHQQRTGGLMSMAADGHRRC